MQADVVFKVEIILTKPIPLYLLPSTTNLFLVHSNQKHQYITFIERFHARFDVTANQVKGNRDLNMAICLFCFL